MIKARIAISMQLCVLGIFVALVDVCNNNTSAYAHNFSPNSLSTFISLAHEADVELLLANSNFPSNITLALDHSKNVVKLMDDAYYSDDDIIDDIDFVRRYNEALNSRNTTIQALVVANIVDQILREYGEAFDIQYDLTNMSNMAMMGGGNSSSMAMSSTLNDNNSASMNMPMNSNIEAEEKNNYTNIINIDNYQSAQKLSEKAYQVFKNQLRPLAASSNNANQTAIIMVEKSLLDLNYLINNKASAQDIMGLVHGKLHPSLQLAYDLKIKQ
jgi:DNA-binding protein Fis